MSSKDADPYSPVAIDAEPAPTLSADALTRLGQLALLAQVAAIAARDTAQMAQAAAEQAIEATARSERASARLATEVMAFTSRPPLTGS